MNASDDVRVLPRDRVLTVYWQGEEATGLLLYALRSPDEQPHVEVCDAWPDGTKCSSPWLLHGDGWAVDLWTIRLRRIPVGTEWLALRKRTLARLAHAGYSVAWAAAEGDFVDPPALFDPEVMGQGLYAAYSEATGFLCRDQGTDDIAVLSDADLVRLRQVAVPIWASNDDHTSAG